MALDQEKMKAMVTEKGILSFRRSDANELVGELENQAQAESSSKIIMSALLEKLGKIAPFASLVTSIMKTRQRSLL